ncbi:LexA family transcriptional regulator [Rhizobium sp. BK456]|uniref:LexA family transcriptional regulator n=1 Tax=Rhizobium sp. BK456 TaxID=2587007 RepID=UPI00161123FE|nr:LexA family transcriptional regulator [Rhizobium sp. BK456]MBB3521087.1 phage repressor protein C with HTH and peptisase S24 domain [Rhizobium sp. BK456]
MDDKIVMSKNWLEPFLKASNIGSQEELAEALDVSRATVNRLANDHSQLKRDRAEKLAPLLGTTVEALMLNQPPKIETAMVSSFDPDASDEDHDTPKREANGKDIPEIDLIAGLGGGGMSIVENTTQNGITFHKEAVRDHWRLPEWMLMRMGVRAPHVAAFPSRGDSMTPTIEDGDVVFIDTRHRVPSPPGVYALADEFGGVVVKRLEVTSSPGDERITVQISSDNPRHMTRILNLDEIQIVGRYIGRFTI